MTKRRAVCGWWMVSLLIAGAAGVLHGQAAPAPEPTMPAQTSPATNSAPVARPGEIYQQAMKPLDVVRSSLDNWSDAELGALAEGIRLARTSCEQSSIDSMGDEDLYDLIRLCALGQDWSKTNDAALKYLSSGADEHRAQAYAMSLNALTRLNDRDGAVRTAEEMLHGLPYDAEVAYALQYFEIYLERSFDTAALTLATEEHPLLLKALLTGQPLKATHGQTSMGVGEMFDSGLRLAFLERYSGDSHGAESTYEDLDGAVAKAAITETDRRLISAAETRYKLLGTQLPEIDARRILATPVTKTKVHADPGFVTVLAIFPDWCPQCMKTMQGLSEFGAEHRAAKVHVVGLMEEDPKPEAGPQKDLKALNGTATLAVSEEAGDVFGAVDYPLIVATDPQGMVSFVGLIPQNAFAPNGYLEQVIGRIVGETAVIRNAAGKTKPTDKKSSQ